MLLDGGNLSPKANTKQEDFQMNWLMLAAKWFESGNLNQSHVG